MLVFQFSIFVSIKPTTHEHRRRALGHHNLIFSSAHFSKDMWRRKFRLPRQSLNNNGTLWWVARPLTAFNGHQQHSNAAWTDTQRKVIINGSQSQLKQRFAMIWQRMFLWMVHWPPTEHVCLKMTDTSYEHKPITSQSICKDIYGYWHRQMGFQVAPGARE